MRVCLTKCSCTRPSTNMWSGENHLFTDLQQAAFAYMSSIAFLICPQPIHIKSSTPCRAKAGGRQSAKDATGKTIKSAGSALRRHNEVGALPPASHAWQSWQPIFMCLCCIIVQQLYTLCRPP